MARALPSLSEDFIRYHLPQERGWSYIHALQVERGLETRWPQPQHNPEHRWWQRCLKALKALRG